MSKKSVSSIIKNDMLDFDKSILYNVKECERACTRAGSLSIIFILGLKSDLRLSWISNYSNVSMATCLVALQKLVLDGYVEKHKSQAIEKNEKVNYYRLTERGVKLFKILV